MAHVFAAVRLLLAVVLTVAGSAKLADPIGSRRAFIDFGGPASLAGIGAWLLPIGEIATALALLSSGFATAGAVAALALFLVFTIVLGVAVARGATADCHCFGQLSATPVGWRTLVRTGVLAVLAGALVAAASSGASRGVAGGLTTILSADLASSLVLIAAAGVVTWMVVRARDARRRELALIERIGALERRLVEHPAATSHEPTTQGPDEGLSVGAAAPDLFAHLARGRPALVLFISSSCPPCKALAPEFAAWRARLGTAADLTVVNRDEGDGKALAEAFRARWTPAGVLISASGRTASPLRYGSDGVKELFAALSGAIAGRAVDEHALHRRLGSRLGASDVVVGDPAPAVELVDAAGQRHPSPDGDETLMLFWDPSCGYCQGMTDDLRALEAAPPPGTPRVAFVIARDAATASAAQAVFSSTSFFDPESTVAPLFGARGTPAAVLVDRNGRVASTVAIGKDAVLSLLVPVPAGLPSR